MNEADIAVGVIDAVYCCCLFVGNIMSSSCPPTPVSSPVMRRPRLDTSFGAVTEKAKKYFNLIKWKKEVQEDEIDYAEFELIDIS
jgi:hypothetical protein